LPAKQKKILFIGIDGFDPNIMETMMGKGEIPAFARLAEQGYYSPLQTINPPQSPVVWTSIATGCTPAEHGIFDFLHSDPKTYLPYLSLLKRDGPRYKTPYEAKTFWEKASDAGIPSTIIKWPVTFPPKPIKGNILAGLGVPDIRGTLGTYAFYTTDPSIDKTDKKGKVIHVQVKNNRIVTELIGPIAATVKGQKEIVIPLIMEISAVSVTCSLGNAKINLKEGQWSDWIQLKFSLGLMASVKGICKLYLKSIHPEFALYITPIHVDPESYVFPISAPYDFAQDLKDEIGRYATLGMPEEANALNDEVIDEEAFLMHCDTLMQEREKIFNAAFVKFKKGILACVFDTTDRVQHMFWRFLDKSHPLYNAKMAEKYGDVIPDYYRRMDKIIAQIMERISDDTLLLICSDHGFSSFKKEVHLNSWLVQNGFMTLNAGHTACKGLFTDVQWSGTKAYAVGFNSIYLNRASREKEGIVSEEEIESTKKMLSEKLNILNDNGTKAISKVYDTKELYDGQHLLNEPDLIIGYNKAYRSSSQSAIGQITAGAVIEDNLKKWSGDHCSEADSVSGIFFSNKKEFPAKVSVLDIAPLIGNYLAL
jgi:predicted AlkP superfamily phosphohydrolase/phosphomutase